MHIPDSTTERAVRAFLEGAPANLHIEQALLYGSRARGDHTAESDADVALVMPRGADDWRTLWTLGGIAYDVFVETGVLIQPVPVSSSDWARPERHSRPSFLRRVARGRHPVVIDDAIALSLVRTCHLTVAKRT